jgi:PBP1b-binding outer membrane lipoprotein LpoB
MKKKFSLAVLIALVLVTVSCTTDTDGVNSTSQKQNDAVLSITNDSITKTLSTTFATDDGVIPPIKPKL